MNNILSRLHVRPSVAAIVGMVFGACTAIAVALVGLFAHVFANELGVRGWVFVAVPSLFGALFALVIYQGAERRIRTIRQSLSRALLVALVTWLSVAGLGTWVWCVPDQYASCMSYALLLSGTVGGGPLMIAALIAGAIGGYVIRTRPPAFRKSADGH
jgi:hypothetical protein